MQSLEVISVNLWNILISLANLVILFLIIKKFLFKPVNNMLNKRRQELADKYEYAENAKQEADNYRDSWNQKMAAAREDAENIIKEAAETARFRGDKIVSDAKEKATGILRQAETQAELELKKAEDGIKREIIDVSTALAGKILKREISVSDHHNLIDSFIENLGDDDEADK